MPGGAAGSPAGTGRRRAQPGPAEGLASGSMSNSSIDPPLRVGAGTAIKFGFFAALGATLFSVIVSIVVAIVVLVLGILGFGIGNLINLPR